MDYIFAHALQTSLDKGFNTYGSPTQ